MIKKPCIEVLSFGEDLGEAYRTYIKQNNMDEFDKALAQIGINNASEINGDLKDYFTVTKREDGTYKIHWEKNISTHIRHKVTALIKKHYVAAKA